MKSTMIINSEPWQRFRCPKSPQQLRRLTRQREARQPGARQYLCPQPGGASIELDR